MITSGGAEPIPILLFKGPSFGRCSSETPERTRTGEMGKRGRRLESGTEGSSPQRSSLATGSRGRAQTVRWGRGPQQPLRAREGTVPGGRSPLHRSLRVRTSRFIDFSEVSGNEARVGRWGATLCWRAVEPGWGGERGDHTLGAHRRCCSSGRVNVSQQRDRNEHLPLFTAG